MLNVENARIQLVLQWAASGELQGSNKEMYSGSSSPGSLLEKRSSGGGLWEHLSLRSPGGLGNPEGECALGELGNSWFHTLLAPFPQP